MTLEDTWTTAAFMMPSSEERQGTSCTSTLLGGISGVGIVLFANALRKAPMMRAPWEHVIGAAVGSSIGAAYLRWEKFETDGLNAMITEYEERAGANQKLRAQN